MRRRTLLLVPVAGALALAGFFVLKPSDAPAGAAPAGASDGLRTKKPASASAPATGTNNNVRRRMIRVLLGRDAGARYGTERADDYN